MRTRKILKTIASGVWLCTLSVCGTSQSDSLSSSIPAAPTIGTATASNASASLAFTAPALTGGSAILSYTATSSPGGLTGTSSSSPITINGLTNGTGYAFTVTATNAIGTSPASSESNTVTPMTSAIVWNNQSLPSSQSWNSVTYGAGLFVAVAQSGTAAASSPDGINWTARTLPSSEYWIMVTHGGGIFVTVSNFNSSAAATSPDGITWTA